MTAPTEASPESEREQHFGEFVSEQLGALGRNPAQFARKHKVSKTYFYAILNGARPSQQIANVIIDGLNSELPHPWEKEELLARFDYVTKKVLHLDHYQPEEHPRWVANLREYRCMSQADFANLVGVSNDEVVRLEQGEGRPTAATIRKLYQKALAPILPEDDPFYFSESEILDTFAPVGIADDDFEDLPKVGHVLKLGRKRARIRLEDLSTSTNIDLRTLGRIESGEQDPTDKQISALFEEIGDVFPEDRTKDDILEEFGYPTLRSIHPSNFQKAEIGSWVERVRRFNAKSQEEFGFEIGKDQTTVGKIERGKTRPRAIVVTQIYRKFVQPKLNDPQDPEYFTLHQVRNAFDFPGKMDELFASQLPRAFGLARNAAAEHASDSERTNRLREAAAAAVIRVIYRSPPGETFAAESEREIRLAVAHELGTVPVPYATGSERRLLQRITRVSEGFRNRVGREPRAAELAEAIAHSRNDILPGVKYPQYSADNATPPPQTAKTAAPAAGNAPPSHTTKNTRRHKGR